MISIRWEPPYNIEQPETPTIYVLIGPPGSGKSTWRDCFSALNPCVTISSDDIIDEYAAQHGMTYSEAFGRVSFQDIENDLTAKFLAAVAAKQTIIIDRTNMTAKSRTRWLSLIPLTAEYLVKAIVFEVSPDVLQDRLRKRAASTGKHIPDYVVERFLENYEPPTDLSFNEVKTYAL